MDQFYREVILDHYKNPHNYGTLEAPHAHAEGQNPLCGDEVAISVNFAADGETIEEIRFEGQGCAISQAATSMLTDLVTGKTAVEVAALPKEELARRDRHSRSPRFVSSARSSASVCSRSHCIAQRARRCRTSGRGWTLPELVVAPLAELPPGSMKIVVEGPLEIGVYNCGGRALRARGPLFARRRPALRGRLGRGALCRRLPAARLRVRPPHRRAAVPAGVPPCRNLPRSRRRRDRHGRGPLNPGMPS